MMKKFMCIFFQKFANIIPSYHKPSNFPSFFSVIILFRRVETCIVLIIVIFLVPWQQVCSRRKILFYNLPCLSSSTTAMSVFNIASCFNALCFRLSKWPFENIKEVHKRRYLLQVTLFT